MTPLPDSMKKFLSKLAEACGILPEDARLEPVAAMLSNIESSYLQWKIDGIIPSARPYLEIYFASRAEREGFKPKKRKKKKPK